MDIKSFLAAVSQISEEKGIPQEKVLESIEAAIAAAYKKDYGEKGQIIKAKLDPVSGEARFWQVKMVVNKKMIYSEEELEELKSLPPEERMTEAEKQNSSKTETNEIKKVRFNPERHIMAEEAKEKNPEIKAGDELEIPLEVQKDYGRIAAQTAKQVILQKIMEAERESVLQEYKSKEGEIISGIVQRIEGRNVFMDIGKTLGILTREEQVPGEFYRPGQRLKVFVLKIEATSRGPIIFLSRAYPRFISKLFELEVPEISSGQVQIKSIAREAGSRSKIAVVSVAEGVDPIGASVGQRGTRVQAVINELGGEKIDIIEYSDEPEKYISNSLSPAKAIEVKIMPRNKAMAIVPEDQLSLAIGKDGQNVRLAAKLTGWKIDVRPPVTVPEAVAEAEAKTEGGAGEEVKEEKPEEAPKEEKVSPEEKPKEKKKSKKPKTKK